MPLKDIDDFLRSNESYILFPSATGIQRVDVCAVASNNPIEDQHWEGMVGKDGALFGVFDGHWDPTCGLTVERHLPAYIAASLRKNPKDATAALVDAFERLDKDLLDLPSRAIPDFDRLTPDQIRALPMDVRRRAMDVITAALTGSCAIMAYVKGSDLYVANAGDSRAVLGVRDKNGKWSALPLSEDHQPSNPTELERLKKEHPGEERTVAFKNRPDGPMRVIGGMMPSRAFGDAKYKWPMDVQAKTDALVQSLPAGKYPWRTPKYCKTPPYMTASPEITHHKLTSDDYFLVLASDGIFDCMTSLEVVEAVAQFYDGSDAAMTSPTGRPRNDPVRDANAATHLVRVALAQGEGQEGVSKMLTIQKGRSRDYRDDMTAQVITFAPGKKALGKKPPPPFVRDAPSVVERDETLRV
ncbi:Pyruvate dehyrogenase phosphatase catalytic subunit [Borealophlyctis nickersoniae]|nr:Pyruvate dehyrogenase phosphatase catalytic subunit [Borealophlyctis nickersoniae]